MAAVVVIAAQEQRRSQRKSYLEAQANTAEFDANHDGHVSSQELQQNIDHVQVRVEVLLERISLEDGLIDLMKNLPLFLLCLFCFLAAIAILSPPPQTAAIHRHLNSHFGLDQVAEVQDTAGIYDFLQSFENKNAELRATSFNYWCEHRYFQREWDDHYLVPVSSCPSPRYTALELQSSPVWTNSTTPSTGGHHRRLSAERRLAGGSTSTGGPEATHANPPCEDNDTAYQIEEDDPNITCHDHASHACATDLGLLYCPRTCGYCAPFSYDRYRKYTKPQVTLLPSVVHQTRYKTKACEGWAEKFLVQNYNPVLVTIPALDGPKNDELLVCVDRTSAYEEDHAFYLDCTPHTPSTRCVDGKIPITAKTLFHGQAVYAKMLIESSRDLSAMKEVGWIDSQTEHIAVSTVIYTEDLEMFTSLTVSFDFDYAGNVEGSVSMVTYKDVILTSAQNFVACLLTTCIGAFFSATASTVHLLRHREQCNWGLTCYEIFSRILLLVYPTILLISWSQQILMSHEFDLLLDTFISSDGVDESHLNHNMQEYFKVKTVIHEEVGWLERHRVASYVLMYFQFLQMVLYFNAHPRVAMLTKTVKGALLNMLHFFLVFTILFLMLAFMAHFLLGGQIQLFGTFGGACETQVRMLFGEFIFVDGAELLSGLSLAMYWLYAASFMLIVFFTLLNFFLAIVVDAFVAVKDEYDKLHCTYNFIYDVGMIPRSLYMHFKLKLPGRKKFIAYLEESLENIKEVRKQAEQKARKKVGHKGVRHQEPPPAEPSGGPLTMPAKKMLEEFQGFSEASLCQLLCRVERLSSTPLIFYVEEAYDNEHNEPREVEDIPEEPSVKNQEPPVKNQEEVMKASEKDVEGVITSSM